MCKNYIKKFKKTVFSICTSITFIYPHVSVPWCYFHLQRSSYFVLWTLCFAISLPRYPGCGLTLINFDTQFANASNIFTSSVFMVEAVGTAPTSSLHPSSFTESFLFIHYYNLNLNESKALMYKYL
jgi:hypothetical protein